MKILIVDDEVELVAILAEDLTALGHEVIEVTSITAAEESWQGCDCVLVDRMKGSNEFARKMKANGLKTISFTGFNKIDSEFKDAFDGNLNKPWDDDALVKLFKK